MASDRTSRDTSLRTCVRLRQSAETPLTTLSTPFGTALYLYARSNDSVAASTIGQDYLAFCYDDHNLTFAVCDGVGQSFMGDLAARVLGDGLNEWLWSLEEAPEDAETFAQQATEALNRLTAAGREAVGAFKLPDHLPPILVQALNQQRQYGSESMFVAGRLALGAPQPWIALCWLGDSPVAAIDLNGELVDLGPRGHTSERWNANTGVKGAIHAWVGSAEHVARVAGYTDGLAAGHVPTDADLALLMQNWVSDPPADDASIFDIRLAPSPETTGQEEPPEPEELEKLPAFQRDETRPITVDHERTPVRDVQPIEAQQGGAVIEEWRPLTEEPEPEAAGEEQEEPAAPQTMPEVAEMLSSLSSQALAGGLPGVPGSGSPSLSAQQQVQMWQQAALLGLTSAALAMLMVDRLVKAKDQEDDKGE